MDDERFQQLPRPLDDDFGFARARPRIAPSAVWQTVTPLRMIFWGGLLLIFDITFTTTTNGHGFKFDILNDAVGAVLIAIGVSRLGAIRVDGRYASALQFVWIVAVVAVLDEIRDHFVMPLPPAVSFALTVFGLVKLAAVIAFCLAMRWFCEAAGIGNAGRSWNVTTWLFVLIYALPLGFFYLAALAAIAGNKSFNINLGPGGLLLLPVFAVPLIHLFVSTSRMAREAEAFDADFDDEYGGPAGFDEMPMLRKEPASLAWLWLILGGLLLVMLLGCFGWLLVAY